MIFSPKRIASKLLRASFLKWLVELLLASVKLLAHPMKLTELQPLRYMDDGAIHDWGVKNECLTKTE